MRHQGIHESVMTYDDYACQPLIQRFYADMEDNEVDEVSRDGQDSKESTEPFQLFGDSSACKRLHTTTWLDFPEWIRTSESRDMVNMKSENLPSLRPSLSSSKRSQKACLRRKDILIHSRFLRCSHGSDCSVTYDDAMAEDTD